MLVLSRKPGERIVLPGCEVTITVTAISNNRVCIGISAPPHVEVHRAEVWKRVCQEKENEQPLSGTWSIAGIFQEENFPPAPVGPANRRSIQQRETVSAKVGNDHGQEAKASKTRKDNRAHR